MHKVENIAKGKQIFIEISLLDKICFLPILEEYGLEKYTICHYTVGNDEQIHILLAKTIPERERGMFVPTESNTEYSAISFVVDWQNGGVWHHEVVNFGTLKPNLHFIQRMNNGFLLVGSRTCRLPGGQNENNALLTDNEGKIVNEYSFGDGIQRCLVDKQNRIITSYFDEGVFGGPISSYGVVLWSAQGELLWKNYRHDIVDCYAINLDTKDNLWFYYYTEFNLVRTNYENETVFHPEISGSSGFLFYRSGEMLLFDAGYDRHGEFTIKKICKEMATLSEEIPAMFTWNGEQIVPESFSFRASKALVWDKADCLYYTEWRNDTMVSHESRK